MKLTKLTLCMVALVTVACSNSKETQSQPKEKPQTQTQTQTQPESESDPNLTGKALEYYQKAKNGDAIAQYELANCYYGTGCGYCDYKKAMEWAKKSASQGCPQGSLLVGRMYEDGDGVTENKAEANKWYTQAFKQATPLADKDDARAQFVLYYLYYKGLGVAEDTQEALRLLKLSIDQGYVKAQHELGHLHYYENKGIELDRTEAAKWFRKAAEQGDAESQYDLADCYRTGDGMPENSTEAYKWYLKSAEQGYRLAHYMLGVMYFEGEGVEKDYTEAVKWFRFAAEQGNMSVAQIYLGDCYANGYGVEKNESEARKWYSKAAEQGDEDAKEALEMLGN